MLHMCINVIHTSDVTYMRYNAEKVPAMSNFAAVADHIPMRQLLRQILCSSLNTIVTAGLEGCKNRLHGRNQIFNF